MRPLVIGRIEKEKLNHMRQFAEQHPYNGERVQHLIAGVEPPAGDIPDHCCILPFDYRIVYSVEEHPAGMARHLSVSVPDKGKLPSVQAVELIMSELEFNRMEESNNIYIDDKTNSINIIQLL